MAARDPSTRPAGSHRRRAGVALLASAAALTAMLPSYGVLADEAAPGDTVTTSASTSASSSETTAEAVEATIQLDAPTTTGATTTSTRSSAPVATQDTTDDTTDETTHDSKPPGTGSPTRILFEVTWETYDGVVHTTIPPEGLVAGWGATLTVNGESQKGTATCAYAPGSATLACAYDNPGHGDQPGLVVPGNPEATYTVEVTGLPDGWHVVAATVGTFVGRDVCPRGHDGDEGGGGHDSTTTTLGPAARGDEGEEGGSAKHTCTHVVALVQDPPPATVPTEVPTTAVAAEEITATTAAALPVASAPRFTG